MKQKTIIIQETKLNTQKPSAEFAINVQDDKTSYSMEKAAKILSDNGVSIGRNTLMKLLREHKILMGNNSTYQRYKEAGLFDCKLTE